jgi:hypothetical protein
VIVPILNMLVHIQNRRSKETAAVQTSVQNTAQINMYVGENKISRINLMAILIKNAFK